MTKPVVAIIMGSDSDLSVMQDAATILDEYAIVYDIRIVSAHRTPDVMYSFATSAKEKGFKVIIAAAGGSAHLPGMTASLTTLPVIGVPIQTKTLSGVDSLYSIVQMPAGIPVATVAINGAKNAALLAIKMLAIEDSSLEEKLIHYNNNIKTMIAAKNEELKKTFTKK